MSEDPKIPENAVWMSCRAKNVMGGKRKPCEGKYALIVRSVNSRGPLGGVGGGKITTFRCTTCNGQWTIST